MKAKSFFNTVIRKLTFYIFQTYVLKIMLKNCFKVEVSLTFVNAAKAHAFCIFDVPPPWETSQSAAYK